MSERGAFPHRLRCAIATLAVAASAVALSGCIVINSASTSQPQSMGPLRLTVNTCANGSPGCTALSSNGGSAYGFLDEADSDMTFPAQILLAVRLPTGATPPASLQTTYDGSPLTFTRDAAYEGNLQALEPAPAGERWWGWLSGTITYGRLEPQGLGVTIEVTLPRPADGGPLPSPLRWRPVVGAREVGVTLPATRPVNCGNTTANLYTGFSDTVGQPTIHCIDFPSQEATRGYLDAPLIDFGILGKAVQAPAGSTVNATFIARRSGAADPTTTFALTATTGVPGGGVSLDQQSVSLGGDTTQPVLATVSVPANAAPGSYPVTVTATAPGKPTRTGTSLVTVPGETLRIRKATVAPRRFRAGRKVSKPRGRTPIGTRLTVDVSAASKLSIAIERKVQGRRKPGKRCSTRTRQGKACSLYKRVGALKARNVVAGKTRIGFPGKLGGRKLSPGGYRFVLVASDSAKRKSAPAKPGFTVVD